MRHLIRFFLTFIFSLILLPTFAAINGRIDYKMLIDYSQLDQIELEQKAEFYYNLAFKTYDGTITNEITCALNLYSMLNKKCPNNQLYAIKLGSLYDLTLHDRLAKSCFYQAIGIDNTQPISYFYLGEFYYRRGQYRQAIKFYTQAYRNGYDRHFETAYKLGDIYQKFGDTEAALKYLKIAYELNPTSELNDKIYKVKNYNSRNAVFYRRIHKDKD